MDDDQSLAPRGGGPPDGSNGPPLVFAMTVAQAPFDYLMGIHGISVITHDLRQTVAKELNKNSTAWLDQTVREAVQRIVTNN